MVNLSTNYLTYTNPEILHEDLKILSGKKISLYGVSYGGRTAVKHAQLYPNTFDKYISSDGGLSFAEIGVSDLEKGNVKDRFNNPECNKAAKWLCPTYNIDQIKDPILIVHNIDDNNVNVKVSLKWYKNAKELGKGDLIRVIFPDKGIVVLGTNKGHNVTDQKNIFDHLSDTIFNFLTNDNLSLSALTDLRVFKTNIYADKYYNNSTNEEKFISEAYRLYKNNHKKNAKTIDPESEVKGNWDEVYSLICKKVIFLDELKNNKISLELEVSRMKEKNLLTNEVIKKAVELDWDYFIEMDSIIHLNSQSTSFENFHYTKNFQSKIFDLYRNWIFEPVTELKIKLYLLDKIYETSPEILKEINYEISNELELQETLISTLIEEKNQIKAIWFDMATLDRTK